MITPAQFDDWLQRYGRAWTGGDPDAAVALFTDDAAYHEVPFAPPMVGAAAIRHDWTIGAKDGQRDVTFDATPIALDGVLAARFDDTGHCREFREWWHRRETAAAALRAPGEREA